MAKYYLKKTVIVEPLIADWYAWSYLMSPATAAMLIANRHLKIMQSYLKAPDLHDEAVKNPAMRGGPFLDAGEKNLTQEVTSLIKKTETEYGCMLELAAALQQLSNFLQNESLAKGCSFASLYSQVPEALKGYVELVYDIENNPSFRLIEPLLYNSNYYNPSYQSILLSELNNKQRPFMLSTPRFATDKSLLVKKPFADKCFDLLFSLRTKGGSLEDIKRLYEDYFVDFDKDLFLSMFEQEEGDNKKNNLSSEFQIKYFGHACILIEYNGLSILIDPLINYNDEEKIPCYTFADLPEKIDYVLITHAHQDHFVLETLLQIRYKIRKIIVPRNVPGALQDPSLMLILKNIGFNNVVQLDELDSIDIGCGKIMGIPFFGEHGDLNIQSKLAYLIELKGRKILCVADSDNIEPQLYAHVKKIIEKVDIIFIGMECEGAPLAWLYGPLFSQPISREANQTRRLNGSDCSKAINLIQQFECKNVYIYAMGHEPWLSFISSIDYEENSKPILEANKLLAYCEKNNIKAKKLFGSESFILS